MKRNNLDEMQEQKLLKVEHNGFWLAYWLLLGAILVQMLMEGSASSVRGELVIFLILCVYEVVGSLRQGIWDRRMKPNFKTNLLGSVIAGLAVAAFRTIMHLRLGWESGTGMLLLAAGMSGLFTSLLTFALMSLTAAIYKKRNKALETE